MAAALAVGILMVVVVVATTSIEGTVPLMGGARLASGGGAIPGVCRPPLLPAATLWSRADGFGVGWTPRLGKLCPCLDAQKTRGLPYYGS